MLSDLGSASYDEAQALAIRQDGKIVSVGYSDAVSSSDFALVRYNVDGSLDAGFGSGGKMLSSFGPSIVSEAFAVAIQSDGKIVAAGDALVNGNEGSSPSPAIRTLNPSLPQARRSQGSPRARVPWERP